MLVGLVSSAALAWLILGIYWIIGDDYYEGHGNSLGDARVWFEVGFYLAAGACVVAAAAVGLMLSKVLRVSVSTTVIPVVLAIGIALLLALPLLSYVNACTFGDGFPFPSDCR